MIEINVDPVIVHLGPFMLTWHALISVVGIAVGVWLTGRLATRAGIDMDRFGGLVLWAIVGGVIGARTFHVLDNLEYYLANPAAILAINQGGIAVYGAIIGGTAAGVAYCLRHGIPVGKLLDAGAPGVLLGQAIGRVGDILNGEHWSLPTDLPWGVVYTNPNTAGQLGVAVHPAAAYEMAWELLAFGLLWRLRGRFSGQGRLFALLLLLYAAGRFFVGFLRQDNIVLLGLRQAQVSALVTAAGAMVFLLSMVITMPTITPWVKRRLAAASTVRKGPEAHH